MKTIFLLFFATLVFINVQAQNILYGPVIGAVTDNSAKMFVRTSGLDTIKVELYTDTAQSATATFTSIATTLLDSSSTLQLSSLIAETKYYYKVYINNTLQTDWYSFKTFPQLNVTSDFSFGFGSCIWSPTDDSVFLEVPKHDLSFFLVLGDWGYYDQQGHFPSQTDFFCIDYEDVVKTYHRRYSSARLSALMPNLPFDYVYDNHDYMYGWSNRDSTTYVNSTNKTFTEYPNPPGCRANSIKGYSNMFPHYPLVDSVDGIYHSFRHGNVEVFMVDNRECRSPLSHAFQKNSQGAWEFNPPSDYRMLGQKQYSWLINGLRNSDATWKFIVSGVPFNKKYGEFMDLLLSLQNVTVPGYGTGFDGAAGIALSSWAGFPVDQDSLLMICQNENIENVIFLSGDSHTSAIDDGGNAGFPELMAGNLAKDNSRLVSLAQSVGVELFNSGGQGLGNSNFNEAFGKVEVFGKDSVVLNIVDLFGTFVASKTIINTDTITIITPTKEEAPLAFTYPNPANDYCWILTSPEIKQYNVSLITIDGKTIKTAFFKNADIPNKLSLDDIPTGTYFLELNFEGGHLVKQLIVVKNGG